MQSIAILKRLHAYYADQFSEDDQRSVIILQQLALAHELHGDLASAITTTQLAVELATKLAAADDRLFFMLLVTQRPLTRLFFKSDQFGAATTSARQLVVLTHQATTLDRAATQTAILYLCEAMIGDYQATREVKRLLEEARHLSDNHREGWNDGKILVLRGLLSLQAEQTSAARRLLADGYELLFKNVTVHEKEQFYLLASAAGHLDRLGDSARNWQALASSWERLVHPAE